MGKRLRLISCEVFYREMCATLAESPNSVDISFLPKGLHNLPSAEMRDHIQAIIDEVPADTYDAILLGFGLCNNGLNDVQARDTKLVLPRAHDCITLFLGDRFRYREYFDANPGTYFLTTGWIERASSTGDMDQNSISRKSGMDDTYEQMVEKYGKDNADFLYEQLNASQGDHYHTYTFIEMGVEPDESFEQEARERAEARGWDFTKVKGDISLIERLINGDWDAASFQVVQPNKRISATYTDETVVTAK